MRLFQNIKKKYVYRPTQLKFKKYHRKKLKYNHNEKSQFINKFGQIGIQACESKRLTSNQLEAVRRSIRRDYMISVFK